MWCLRVAGTVCVLTCAISIAACGDDAAVADAGPSDSGGLDDAGADTGSTPDGRWFEDVTVSAGIGFSRVPADAYQSIPDRFSGGVCVVEADGVAPLDLFFAMRPAGASRLYVSRGPFDFEDQTAARGLGDAGDALGCLAFDADGDGDDDLLVTGPGTVQLFRNDGGAFVDDSTRLGFTPDPRDLYTGAAAGDLDADGDLDIVVGGYVRIDPDRYAPGEICGDVVCAVDIKSYDPIPHLLLVRASDGRYEERAAELAPTMRLLEPALVMAIEDLDLDGRQDIFIGNDIGDTYRNRVLLWDGVSAFVDGAEDLGLAYDHRGYGIDAMAWTSGDVDGDGRLDHAVTGFEGDSTAVFLMNDTGTYDDRALSVGTEALAQTFRWGAALVDLDLDGDPELIEATGHYLSDDEAAAAGLRGGQAQPANLMENRGDGTLVVVEPVDGDGLRTPRAARGLVVVDLDDDGRPDVVLGAAQGPPAVLRNVRTPVGHPLRVRLAGRSPNTGGVGALVTVRTGGRVLLRRRLAGEGYLGSFDPRLHFGLPSADPVEVEVRWPSGATEVLNDVAPGGEIQLVEP